MIAAQISEFQKFIESGRVRVTEQGGYIIVTSDSSLNTPLVCQLDTIPDNVHFQVDYLHFTHLRLLPGSTRFTGKDILFTRLKELPEGFTFSDLRQIHFKSLLSLPATVSFQRVNKVVFDELQTLPYKYTFSGKIDLEFKKLKIVPDEVVFENNGDVDLFNVSILPDGYRFYNIGYVEVPKLKKIPNEDSFNYATNLYLREITDIPKNYRFINKGMVCLNSIDHLTGEFSFPQASAVSLPGVISISEEVIIRSPAKMDLRGLQSLPEKVRFVGQEEIELSGLSKIPKPDQFSEKTKVTLKYGAFSPEDLTIPPAFTISKADKVKEALLLSNLGLPVDLTNKVIVHTNRFWRVSYINKRASANPVVIVDSKGKETYLSVTKINAILTANKLIPEGTLESENSTY